MMRLSPYLSFAGNCRQAMEFYRDCLGGELRIMTVGQSPMAAAMPQMKDQVMHSSLESPGIVLLASDMMGVEGAVSGNTLRLCINGGTRQEIEPIFARLSAGGTVGTPLRDEFFGTYGEFTDRFGVKWMFQAEPGKRSN